METQNTNKGITLIALVITIIVMLILVGVSVTVALNGGLFSTAQRAAGATEAEKQNELALSSGRVQVGDLVYNSIEDYRNNNPIIDPENPEDPEGGNGGSGGTITLPTGWSVAETKPTGWSNNVIAITDGTNTIPLPNGFEISTKETEDSIDEGLVLKDGANEFVWIPVEDYETYTEDSFGPIEIHFGIYDVERDDYVDSGCAYDSQGALNYFYGMLEDGTTPYYNYSDFTYATDKTNVENNIKTYGGFYVGRYETTIDGSSIGVQKGKTVLTETTLLKEGTNTGEGMSGEPYYYRWWGLYKAQKDMYANNEAVGSLMISDKQWDTVMNFTKYYSTIREWDSYLNSYYDNDSSGFEVTKPDLSGSAYKTDSTQYDVKKNIYDLAGNVSEWMITAYSIHDRHLRGGSPNVNNPRLRW